jgi:hypothetical protein
MTQDPRTTYGYFHELVKVQDWLIHIGATRPRFQAFVEDLNAELNCDDSTLRCYSGSQVLQDGTCSWTGH